MKKSLFLLALLMTAVSLFGQNCNCLENFENLVTKVENDYAGFSDKVNTLTRSEYEKHTELYRKKISETTTTLKCVLLMEKWLEFFNDKHLRISTESNIYWTFKSIDSTALLMRIPNFEWSSKPIIDSIIHTNYNLITKTPILIIDLRGNGGGTDYSYLELLQFLYTNTYESKGVEWLASLGNIEILENCLKTGKVKQGYEKELGNQIKLMKEHQNRFVSLDSNSLIVRDSILEYPKQIGLIVNDFCASSCEQFILIGKNSSKTTVFGTNTLGVLDYSNMQPISLPMEGITFSYPMTRSKRLPENPIDNIGIEPDVRINLPDNLNLKCDIDDWVLYVKEYLEKKLNEK